MLQENKYILEKLNENFKTIKIYLAIIFFSELGSVRNFSIPRSLPNNFSSLISIHFYKMLNSFYPLARTTILLTNWTGCVLF